MNEEQVSFYVDTMIVEAISSNPVLVKSADTTKILNSLIDKVKNYFSAHIDPNNKVKSIISMLAPGAVWIAFRAMGLGWLGSLLGLAMNVFHIDTGGFLASIYEKVKSLITGNTQVTSSQIDDIVHSTVAEHNSPPSEDEAEQFSQNMTKATLRDAQFLKIALIEYDQSLFNKQAASSSFFSIFSSKKSKVLSLLGTVVGWFFKIGLAAAGLLVAGDAVSKLLGRPNAFDDTLKDGKPVIQTPTSISHQTKFKINPNYHDEILNSDSITWAVNITNTKENIEQLVLNFAKEVYPELTDTDILNSNKFKNIVDTIAWYNHTAFGGPMVFIPRIFTSKKQLVDNFIDEIAAAAG